LLKAPAAAAVEEEFPTAASTLSAEAVFFEGLRGERTDAVELLLSNIIASLLLPGAAIAAIPGFGACR
jgi:hypothetical protein